MQQLRPTRARRGATTAQIAVVLAVVTMAVIAGVSQLGANANIKLAQTATDLSNPASLTGRFGGSSGSDDSSSSSGSTSSGSTSGDSTSSDSTSGGSDSTGSDSGSSGSSMCP
jgi:Flp pilus assembly pilin Flp